MLFALFALFVIGPIAEIYVLITAGSVFGAMPVIAACLLTALIGGWIIRLQGLKALNEAQTMLAEGELPVGAVIDGVLIVVAAPLLMTPGFITDFFGFALLTPPFRRWLAAMALNELRKRQTDGRITIIER